jgi:hypothetical protein
LLKHCNSAHHLNRNLASNIMTGQPPIVVCDSPTKNEYMDAHQKAMEYPPMQFYPPPIDPYHVYPPYPPNPAYQVQDGEAAGFGYSPVSPVTFQFAIPQNIPSPVYRAPQYLGNFQPYPPLPPYALVPVPAQFPEAPGAIKHDPLSQISANGPQRSRTQNTLLETDSKSLSFLAWSQ